MASDHSTPKKPANRRFSDEERAKRKKIAARRCADRIRAERRRAGLCYDCGLLPVKDGFARCCGCLAKLKRYSVERRLSKLAAKKCRRCNGRQDRKSGGICSRCLERDRAVYHVRKEKKQCIKCGTKPVPGKTLCLRCATKKNADGVRYKENLKREVLSRYGGSLCACCGEKDLVFLTIDHVDGGGAQHRRELTPTNKRGGGGHSFYTWLKRMGFPKGYQVLCFNCNFAKWALGVCPHEKNRIPDAGPPSPG